jgi:hypothetical protein
MHADPGPRYVTKRRQVRSRFLGAAQHGYIGAVCNIYRLPAYRDFPDSRRSSYTQDVMSHAVFALLRSPAEPASILMG